MGKRGGGLCRHRDPGVRVPAAQPAASRPLGRPDAGTPRQDTSVEASRPPLQPSHATEREAACHPASTPSKAGRVGPWSTRPATSSARSTPSTWTTRPASPSGPWFGLFTAKTTFVPLAQAQDTDSVQVPYDKQQVIDAPTMEADGQLSQDEEAELYRHYGLDYSEHRSDSGLPLARPTTATLLAGTPRGRPPTTP